MEIQDINVNTEVQENKENQEVVIEATPKEKTFTQDDVNRIVQKEKAKMERKWEEKFNALEESIKLQSLSESEKAEYQAKKERDAFEEERKAFYAERDAFNHAKYKQTIEQQLQAKGLPIDMADLLTNLTAEEVSQKISSMEQSFNSQINSSIEARVKASASVPTTPIKESKPLTLEDINNMSPQEIKAHKSEVEKVLLNSFRK